MNAESDASERAPTLPRDSSTSWQQEGGRVGGVKGREKKTEHERVRVHAEQREEAAPGPASMIIIDILAMISSLFLFTPADIEPPSIKPKGKCDQTPFFFLTSDELYF